MQGKIINIADTSFEKCASVQMLWDNSNRAKSIEEGIKGSNNIQDDNFVCGSVRM
jgi:hypothetical protein